MARKHYRTLGLEENATPGEIKAQRRKLAKKFHPDVNPDGSQKFQEVQRAWMVLSDPDRRRRYDETGEDEEKPAANQVATMLGELFNGIMQKCASADVDVVEQMKRALSDVKVLMNKRKREIGSRVRLLEKVASRLKCREGENILEGGLRGQIDALKQQVSHIDEELKVALEAEEALEGYFYELPNFYQAQTSIFWGIDPGFKQRF